MAPSHTPRRHRYDSGSLYTFDAAWISERRAPLAGADEAGRGALAGPLVATAVVLGERWIPALDDSKALPPNRREELYVEVLDNAGAVSLVSFPSWWIDRKGVGAANKEALRRASEKVRPYCGCILADGNLKLGAEVECLPKADAKSAAVAAASVVAKVLRDAAMHTLSGAHPEYGFERNRGYGTPEHRLSLKEIGPCRVHRLSYSGVY